MYASNSTGPQQRWIIALAPGMVHREQAHGGWKSSQFWHTVDAKVITTSLHSRN
jgi:hypothetical protein